jgi:hypothetical protein
MNKELREHASIAVVPSADSGHPTVNRSENTEADAAGPVSSTPLSAMEVVAEKTRELAKLAIQSTECGFR